ncbi:class I SAM-dependent methyltransferase [Streptomyces inhibens]|uniref:Class I SAM-dependent methyltransferase n=1 Tax=Streptomyces inhibens TaxID=2293571 RepID=A0A371QAW2_STRIH|nr:class I SAM-dependent methyltransferase [Streptomyces inhibens]REK91836.1 class I SAM-dependent methyltransferase [Streptomyces inhibens]
MFAPQGPTFRELAVQAMSSVERGYDLLAPKFDRTPFRTPERVLTPVSIALQALGPFGSGLDLCCGTGAGMDVLRQVCKERVTGVDISAGMLAVGRARERMSAAASRGQAAPQGEAGLPVEAEPPVEDAPCVESGPSVQDGPCVEWVRADARALPFGAVFDLAVSFGAFGHFLPRERPGLFAQVHSVLRPGGRFVFPIGAPPRPGSSAYWTLLAFDAAMRVRNALWHPPFVMYYRAFRLADVRAELARTGFEVELHALPELGRRPDGSPRCRLVVATRAL